MALPLRPQAASVEDYSSDINECLPHTRRVASTKQARRPSGLSRTITREQDGFSDSGYSSHAATATSSESANNTPLNASPPIPSVNPAAPKRRPTLPSSRSHSTHRSSSKGPSRTNSPAPRPPRKVAPHDDCDCKLCTGRSPPTPGPLETQWDTSYYPFNAETQQFKPPPSPTISRSYPMPGSFPQDPPPQSVAPPARPTVSRASTSHSLRPSRPTSYHGQSSMNGPAYMQQQGYYPPPPPNYHQGPPPALANYPQSMFAPPPYPPPSPATTVPPQMNSPFAPPPLPNYTHPHPQNPRYDGWSEGQQQLGQQQFSVRGTRPIVEYGYQPQAPPPVNRRASLGVPIPASAAKILREAPHHDSMPPPPMSQHSSRPTTRYGSSPNTGFDISRTMSVPPPSDAGATVMPSSRRTMTPGPQTQPHPKRPGVTGSSRKQSSHSNSTKVSVESNSSSERRKASFYDHERAREQEREREQAYQGAIATRTPLTMEALRAARGQRALGSDSGSQSRESHSSHEGSENRAGSGMALSLPDSEADNFTMRYPAGIPLKLEFTGRALAQGHFISLKPGEEGEPYELSIGSRRHVERQYAQIEYARTEHRSDHGRREIEDGRSYRDTRPANRSRRSSRSIYNRD